MNKLETLVVPEELGVWLADKKLGKSSHYFTIIDALFHYWDNTIDSPIGSFIGENKKELIEVIIGSRKYKIEGPLYYALIKGHELVVDGGDKYWDFDTSNGDVFPSNRFSTYGAYTIEMSKSEWNELGINDSNADFVKVDE